MPKSDPNPPCYACELPPHMRHCMESKYECQEWYLYQEDKKKGTVNE